MKNNVYLIKFDTIYSFHTAKKVINNFDKIFQGLINVDSECTFLLSCYYMYHIHAYQYYNPNQSGVYVNMIEDNISMSGNPFMLIC